MTVRASGRSTTAATVLVLALALVSTVSCINSDDGDGDEEADRSGTMSSTTTAPPTTTTTVPSGIAFDTGRPADGACPAVPARARPDAARPRYEMDVRLDLAGNSVHGTQIVTFTPDLAVDRLVFRLWANAPRTARGGADLQVDGVRVIGGGLDGSAPIEGDLTDPTTLSVPLGRQVAAGTRLQLSLTWQLTLPGAVSDRISRSGDSVRLGSFFPILAWEPTVGWGETPPTSGFAESGVSPAADFDYSVTVPDGLQVLASGEPVGDRWRATGVRDIGVTIGRMRLSQGMSGPVSVTVGVAHPLQVDADRFRDLVVRSLDDLSARYGAYPWPALSVGITPGLNGGIEYPGHILQGPGTLNRTTPHEVAHQWFYGLVGNHQGRDPWLDEGLATWAEARVLDDVGTYLRRSLPVAVRGRLGEPMDYWDRRLDVYYEGVYLQGAQALGAVAAPDVVDCALRLYVASNAFGVADTGDLVAALEQVAPGAGETLRRYGAKV